MNETFKDIVLESTSEEKFLMHQEHAYFTVLSSAYCETHTFREAFHQKYPE